MLALGFYYIRWHYTFGVSDLIGVVLNFLWFFYEFFSIPLLLKTMFVPFHRLEDEKVQGFNPSAIAQRLLINTLMRFVGVIVRVLVISIGLVLEFLTLIFGFVILFVWLCAPAFLALLVGFALTFIAVGT